MSKQKEMGKTDYLILEGEAIQGADYRRRHRRMLRESFKDSKDMDLKDLSPI